MERVRNDYSPMGAMGCVGVSGGHRQTRCIHPRPLKQGPKNNGGRLRGPGSGPNQPDRPSWAMAACARRAEDDEVACWRQGSTRPRTCTRLPCPGLAVHLCCHYAPQSESQLTASSEPRIDNTRLLCTQPMPQKRAAAMSMPAAGHAFNPSYQAIIIPFEGYLPFDLVLLAHIQVELSMLGHRRDGT